MASRVQLVVGGALVALVIGGAAYVLMQSPTRRMQAAFAELRSARTTGDREEIRKRIAAIPADGSLRPFLIAALSDRDHDVARTAAEELDRVGLPAEELLDAFVGGNRSLRAYAAHRLDDVTPSDEALVPGLMQGIGHEHEAVRQRAIVALGAIGPAAKAAVPKLTAVLREGDLVSAANAATALGQIGAAASDAIPALMSVVHDGTKVTVLRPAIEALGRMGEPARVAIPLLVEKLPDSPAKATTLVALSQLGANGADLEPHLDRLQWTLGDAGLNPADFAATVRLLAPLGDKARKLLPDLFAQAPRRAGSDIIEPLRRIDPEAAGVLEAAAAIDENPDGAASRAAAASFKLNGRRFLFVPYRMKWEEARAWCEARGGKLFSIRSPQEQDMLIAYARRFERRRVWFGASDRRAEGKWQWEDDSPWGYARWNDGEPNNSGGDENFGEIYLDTPEGGWNDGKDWGTYPFVVQWTD